MTTINVHVEREEIEKVLEANNIAYDKQEYTIKVWHDSDAGNPWKEWEGNIPMMYKSDRSIEDLSDGEIDLHVFDSITDAQLLEQSDIITQGHKDYDEYTFYAQLDVLKDEFEEKFRNSSLHGKSNLMDLYGIKNYYSEVRGYSQGDHAYVLFVPTVAWEELTGAKIEDVTDERFTFAKDLFQSWAFGDVYGFTVEDNYGNSLDSCGGFYGSYTDESTIDSMIENINLEAYGLTEEVAKEMIKNAEIQY